MVHYLLTTLFFISIPFLLGSCQKDVESQKAQESFDQGKWPTLLEQLAHPKPSSQSWPMLAQKQEEHSITVAVIDTGVDYLHPELLPQTQFTMVNGKPYAAGYDVLGESFWAAPRFINPTPFAFGASSIKEGKIVGALPDPFLEIEHLNTVFMQKLTTNIQNHDVLKNSLFNKIDDRNFGLWGGLYIAQFFEEEARQFHHTTYQEFKDKNLLISRDPQNSNNIITMLAKENLLSGEGILRTIRSLPWEMNESLGIPRFTSEAKRGLSRNFKLLGQIEHFDLFLDLLKKSVLEFDESNHFNAKFKTYLDFIEYRMAPSEISESGDTKQAYKKLHLKWFRQHFHYKDIDPLRDLVFEYCQSLSDQEFQHKSLSGKEWFNKNFSHIEQVNSFFLSGGSSEQHSGVDRTQKLKAENYAKRLPKIKMSLSQMLEERGWSIFNCEPSALEQSPQHQLYAMHGEKTKNPYLSELDSENYHGTHVAGIIAHQNPNISILPIRVMTRTMGYEESFQKKIKNDFLIQFKEWISTPLLQAYLEKIRQSDFTEIDSLQEMTQFVLDKSDLFFEDNFFDHYFFHDFKKAISYIARKKVKLANISLGTSFEKNITRIDKDDPSQKAQDFNNLLTYEFFKYQIAKQLREETPETLYIVAAGNSGAWIDGLSRSGLPCDISSPPLEKLAKELSINYPTKNLSNLLCVGSINDKQELSSFTNIVLNDRPFVLSYGERIFSLMKSDDCQGSEQQVLQLLGKEPVFENLSSDKRQTIAFLRSQNLLSPNEIPSEQKVRNLIEDYNNATRFYFSELMTAYKLHRCVTSPLNGAYLSGTSMATPAVAGAIASWIAEEMKVMNIKQKEVYLHPRFSPQNIIKELMDRSPSYGEEGEEGIIKNIRKVLNVKQKTT